MLNCIQQLVSCMTVYPIPLKPHDWIDFRFLYYLRRKNFINAWARWCSDVTVTEFPLSSSKMYGPIIPKDAVEDHTITLALCSGSWCILWWLVVTKYREFCLFIYPLRRKYASSLISILSIMCLLTFMIFKSWREKSYSLLLDQDHLMLALLEL